MSSFPDVRGMGVLIALLRTKLQYYLIIVKRTKATAQKYAMSYIALLFNDSSTKGLGLVLFRTKATATEISEQTRFFHCSVGLGL